MYIMENTLNILNEVKYEFEYEKEFKKILDEVGLYFDEKVAIEVDLNIVNNEIIRQISKDYYKKDKATDVLSFPSDMNFLKDSLGFYHLGEIFLNYERVIEQAKNYNHSIKREFTYLFTHGLIHLYGYDHISENEEKEMNSIVDSIMKKINIGRI